MRYLLAAINAKYIHSNLGIYSLRRYAMERLGLGQKDEQGAAVGMEMVSEAAKGRESNENRVGNPDRSRRVHHQPPDGSDSAGYLPEKTGCGGISCYIWNIVYVKELIHDLKKGSSAGPHLDGRSGGFV